MTFDPYRELEIPRDAPVGEVKRAYRRKAKCAHPDGGGSSEAFERISKSLLVLSDPERRAKYDRTGEIDEQTPDNAVAVAVSIIVGFISEVVQQFVIKGGGDPVTVDLVTIARGHFKKQIREFESAKVPIVKMANKMEQVEKRFRARKKSNPLVLAALKNQRLGTQTPLRELDNKITQLKDALALLDGYDFEFDKPPVQPGEMRTAFFIGTFGT